MSVNPFEMLSKAKSMAAIADAKSLHMAAMAYGYQSDFAEDVTLQKLVDEQVISSAYRDGVKGNYRFTVRGNYDGVTVNADPVNAQAGTQHFFVDEHGVLFVEEGRSASANSREYSY